MREVIVEVDADGHATVKTQGFAGTSCVEAVKQLIARLKALGVDVDVDAQKLTAEYYQSQTQQTKVKLTST